MDLILIISNLVKIFIISLLIYFVYAKIINFNNHYKCRTIFICILSINISIIYLILTHTFQPLTAILILYILYGLIIISIKVENRIYYRIIAYSISYIIVYLIYVIATMISGVLLWIFGENTNAKNPISFIIIPCITFLLYYILFKVKRFKSGFNFLKGTKINKHIIIFIFIICGIVTSLYVFFQNKNKFLFNIILIVESIVVTILLIIWIKSQITKTYKNKMRDRTIEMQKAEIDEKEKIIEEIKAENLKFANTIHKYNHKFESLEFAMKNALKLDSKEEFANEIAVILEESKNTAKNFAKETKVDTRKIPLTNINGIDTMFKYMQEEAIKNNIQFDLKINANINSLINEIIPKEKFETLIGDHIKDAIIAINSNNKTYKSILVTLGLVDGIYEFSVYDTGIEFKIDTLLKLGIEQVTTHKEEGGSGIGFMTTFKTLKECKASLVIEEYNPETTNYTKAITIRFDGKNEYKIYSYRAEKIKEQKGKRRIIIKRIK